MAGDLTIWLYGSPVARVEQERKRLRLHYTDDALGAYELGSPLLSLSLPLVAKPYPNGVTRAFLDGLLPEGDTRNAIAADLGLVAADTYGLIRALGRDCAGALVIQPEEDPKPRAATTQTAEALNDTQLGNLLANLRDVPLGIDNRVRISLAGVQEKLVLTRLPDGSWGRPVDGTPSTHIVKPQASRFPHTVENEAFCMRVAQHLGLDVARVEIATMAGFKTFVVERYDRSVDDDGHVTRIHQEDFCQAMGIPPQLKYQDDGGPSLRQIAEILQSAAAPDSLDQLLQAVTFNVLIANGDAHGKNLSLIHDQSGPLRLAPLYDLICTLVYEIDRLAMYVDNVRRTNRVSEERLLNEAAGWGMSRRRATGVVRDLIARAPDAILAARESVEGFPEELPLILDNQLQTLGKSGA